MDGIHVPPFLQLHSVGKAKHTYLVSVKKGKASLPWNLSDKRHEYQIQSYVKILNTSTDISLPHTKLTCEFPTVHLTFWVSRTLVWPCYNHRMTTVVVHTLVNGPAVMGQPLSVQLKTGHTHKGMSDKFSYISTASSMIHILPIMDDDLFVKICYKHAGDYQCHYLF